MKRKMARRIVRLHSQMRRLKDQAATQRDALETTEAQLRLAREMLAEIEGMARGDSASRRA